MKNIAICLLLIFAIGCSSDSETGSESNTDSNSSIVSDFLDDISSLEDIEEGNPITLFQGLADDGADKIINFSKDNIEDFLETAQDFEHCVITIEDHTIIKIADLSNCTQSGSWGACMPFAEGYIKKGELVYQEDYMNNIIGLPDSQDRKAYLFN